MECVSAVSTLKKQQHPNDIILKEHDVVIKDKKEIANIFNDYFVNIARDLNEITGKILPPIQVQLPFTRTLLNSLTRIVSASNLQAKYKLSSYY